MFWSIERVNVTAVAVSFSALSFALRDRVRFFAVVVSLNTVVLIDNDHCPFA